MPRRKLYPMPIEGIVDHPEFLTMPVAGRGILITLLLHFWASGCLPLPKGDLDKRYLARAHPPTWRRWSPSVLRVFEAVRPALEAYFRLRESHGTTLREIGRLGGQSSAAKLRSKTVADKARAQSELAAQFRAPQRERLLPERPPPSPQARGQRAGFLPVRRPGLG
jgi:hypothetical protein